MTTVYNLINEINDLPRIQRIARVIAVKGLLVEIAGAKTAAGIGTQVNIYTNNGRIIAAEIVGFSGEIALAMPFTRLDGVHRGAKVVILPFGGIVYPTKNWQGRILNAFAKPIDQGGEISRGIIPYSLRRSPPPANSRGRIGERINLGVRGLNNFLTCCRGQRMGIFSGSGIGKSVLLSMITRHCVADVIVIGLIGERGREVKEFISDDLGVEGLARSVVIVATSDESALMRRQAAYLTMATAEYFRDQGLHVMCLIDSVTRFAMAQREIGLSSGEPPSNKGYTPTVFSELPYLLERAGPGVDNGSITGFFTVLVEGDDHNEPITDAVRSILDGHIVLERKIAEQGRYPAINILRSISRTMPDCNPPQHNNIIKTARRYMSIYDDMSDMIKLGAYTHGSHIETDKAIALHKKFEGFLNQAKSESSDINQGYEELSQILQSVLSAEDINDQVIT